MFFPDAEIFTIGSNKWVLLIPGRTPEYFKTKASATWRLRWLRKWKSEQSK